jgi:hypothetical protein
MSFSGDIRENAETPKRFRKNIQRRVFSAATPLLLSPITIIAAPIIRRNPNGFSIVVFV